MSGALPAAAPSRSATYDEWGGSDLSLLEEMRRIDIGTAASSGIDVLPAPVLKGEYGRLRKNTTTKKENVISHLGREIYGARSPAWGSF
ncbi:hypothetical protein VTK73DRAFT_6244 [Phialemonium thermophilum]|uniref:Uncharacterized protein n=1 Tax=Phialemonium thermophilum TaxID=223376 RepID=A0ABR3V028_9PEZI